MALLVIVLALLAGAQGKVLTCHASSDEDGNVNGPECNSTDYAQLCYYSFDNGGTGCVQLKHADTMDASAPGCNEGRSCWCLEDNCNTKEWAENLKKTYVPPPQCWTGITGANIGPSCEVTQLYKDSEYKKPECYGRSLSNECVENNKDVGMGDGCGDGDKTTLVSCESYRNGSRQASESFDGTSRHCRWIPTLTKDERKNNCAVDNACTWFPDQGEMKDGVYSGQCFSSNEANANETAWDTKRGKDCETRFKFGCFENNDHMGEMDRCTNQKDETSCLAQVNDCSEGICTGTPKSGITACASKTSEHGCTGESGCSWQTRCCQWVPRPIDENDHCLNSGKGTMDGMCKYNDGVGPPGKEFIGAAFEYSMFRKQDRYESKCSLIASFRDGKGSAITIGSDRHDLVASNCKAAPVWKDLAEHIGHTSETIDEYCQNLIPDEGAMATIANYKPSTIIEAAKQGQLGAIMPALKDLPYIVTQKPEYGECLFFADAEKYGVAVCTCEGVACNNKSKLEFILDRDVGPMRLLQFLDGSLSDLKDDINKVVNILDANGKINMTNIGQVTKANVDAIMSVSNEVAKVSDKTNVDELWGLVQDYQEQLKAQENYETEVMNDWEFSALKTDSTIVDAANKAAGCQLYRKDGVPNVLCLGSLSEDKLRAVAKATGFDTTVLKAASLSPSILRPRAASCSGMLDFYQDNGCCTSRFGMPISYNRLHFALPSKPYETKLTCGDVKRAYQSTECCMQKLQNF